MYYGSGTVEKNASRQPACTVEYAAAGTKRVNSPGR